MYKKHDANYHAHTYLCGHATGLPVDYINEAIKQNFKIIGITEHAPMANLRNVNSRLKEEDYQTYHKLLDDASKYAKLNNIKLYRGLEIEYFDHIKVYDHYLKDFDYLILGQHYIIKDGIYKSSFKLDSLEDVKLYAKLVLKALKTNYFNLLCHPDLCFSNIKNPTDEMYEELREVIKTAKKLNIPLELNANGIRKSKYENGNVNLDYNKFKYPKIKFFQMVKEENADVIITSDSHKVSHLNDWAIKEAYKFASKLNLNVVNRLNMEYYKKPLK